MPLVYMAVVETPGVLAERDWPRESSSELERSILLRAAKKRLARRDSCRGYSSKFMMNPVACHMLASLLTWCFFYRRLSAGGSWMRLLMPAGRTEG